MTNPPDLGLYLVTDTRMCAGRGLVSTVRSAVEGGVTMVQLRDPEASGRGLYTMATALVDALSGTAVPLIVNDRFDVALASGAAGVHLGQRDLPAESVRRIAGTNFVIGVSANTPGQIAEVSQLPPGTVNYVGIGPVFSTQTKLDAAEPIGIAGLANLAALIPLPTVAIGGIRSDNVAGVRATGVTGVAVVSAICAAEDPEAAAQALLGERWPVTS